MKVARSLIFALLLISLVFAGCNSKTEWKEDFDEALSEAQKEDKDLLILFTGNDWDGISTDFFSNVLATEKFLKAASVHYVPVHFDIPFDIPENDGESHLKERKLTELAIQFNVQYFPTLIAVTTAGQVYAIVDYMPDDDSELMYAETDRMVLNLDAAYIAGREILALSEQMEKAEGVEKAVLIDRLIRAVPVSYGFQFLDLMKTIPDLDPENQSGIVPEYIATVAYSTAILSLSSGDTAQMAATIEEAATHPLMPADLSQQLFYLGAGMCYNVADFATARDFLLKLYEIDPTSDIAAEVPALIATLSMDFDEE